MYLKKLYKMLVTKYLWLHSYYHYNRIYNKILDRDWFSAHLFVMESACNHVGVQFERFVIEYL